MSEELAKRFHDVYEKFAVEYGWKTQEQCQVEFEDLPKENRDLMVAVVSEVCADLIRDSKRLDKFFEAGNVIKTREDLDRFLEEDNGHSSWQAWPPE